MIIVDFTKEEMQEAVSKAVSDAISLMLPRQTKELYSRQEVCDLCHITKPTFHSWVNSGILKVEKIGRRTLITASSLHEAMTTKKVYQFKHQE